MTLRTRIIGAMAACALTIAGMGGLAAYRISAINHYVNTVAANWLPSVDAIARASETVQILRQFILRHSIVSDAAGKQEVEGRLNELQASIDKFFVDYQALLTSPAEQRLFDASKQSWQAYRVEIEPTLALSRAGQNAAAAARIMGVNTSRARTLTADFDALKALNKEGSTKDAEAAASTASSSIMAAGAVTLLAFLGAAGMAIWLVRGVSLPILRTAELMRQIADGKLTVTIEGKDRTDEIGHMARALEVFRANAERARDLAASQEAEHRAKEQRAARMTELVSGFEGRVGEMVSVLSSASTELEATARSMESTAVQARAQATEVAGAATQASGGVQTVAAAAEELSASIIEISRQVAQASSVATRAVDTANATNATVQNLSDGASRIGEVVNLINNIAGQTNLLALNATIEAARAGEAGKGFAVVASEVKSLAAETAKATDEIGQQVGQIQGATRGAVEAIGLIMSTVKEISEITVAIAASVEEQSAATQEIARTVQQTAEATGMVGQNIAAVSQSANDTGAAASQVLAAASDLSSQSEQLTAEVHTFTREVRAA
ncbi:methyl-accepting chemotaxis protein [Muricoccus aerilatus]|uniref:methyl-accepting chemotaxis protein n=1 Tax=Muricoccus aerilatus TaxID=452982 RepID=UPI0005C1402F|nr:methyl-accepting chemotaxis protein [Roseomonas aerilata]